MTLNGIDVSASGQGAAFNWAPYKGKISFAFTKISEGLNYADPTAARNIAQMRAEAITPGGYHFLHAGESGAAQAEFFLSHANGLLNAGCLIALDVEDGGLDGRSPGYMDQVAAAFVNELRKHHDMWPVLYTEISLAGALVHEGSCPLWLANPSGMAVKSIGPWKGGPSFEQTSQRGVDCDVFYGDAAQLAKLTVPK
jgi:lysozyme